MDLLALVLERIQDEALIAELICNGEVAIDLLKQVFKRSRMAPSQQPIQILDFAIQFIVPLRSDGDDAVGTDPADHPAPFLISVHPRFFCYPDLHEDEILLRDRCHKDGCDNERTEIVSLAGFVDPDTAREVKIGWGRHSEKLLGENDGVAR